MKRKNIIFLLIISIFLITLLLVYTRKMNQNTSIKISNNINANNIAVMVENELGNYVKWNNLKFPTNLYLNHEKSYCENGSTLIYNQTTKKLVLTGNTSDKCYAYFDKRFSSYITNLYDNSIDIGDGELNYHNNTVDINNDGSIDDAGDFSYRYSGNNPYNFVCFGTDDCSKDENNEHLYRIIGVFPIKLDDGTIEQRVKLIKSEYLTEEELGMNKYDTTNMNYQMGSITPRVKKITDVHTFRWINENGNNNWLNSELRDKLNNEENGFLRNFDKKWIYMIVDTKWYIGGTAQNLFDLIVPRKAYENEIGINRVKEGEENKCIDDTEEFVTCTNKLLETNDKIGLMHISDYGYTVNKENWINVIHNNSSQTQKMNNWLYNGFYEFFITRDYLSSNIVFQIDAWGYAAGWDVINQTVRPTFYLKNSIKYLSGSGKESDPYYIEE